MTAAGIDSYSYWQFIYSKRTTFCFSYETWWFFKKVSISHPFFPFLPLPPKSRPYDLFCELCRSALNWSVHLHFLFLPIQLTGLIDPLHLLIDWKFNYVVGETSFPHLTLLSVEVKVLDLQSCPTLCDPIDRCPPGSFVHGILQARILECEVIPFFRGFSRPRDKTQVCRSLSLIWNPHRKRAVKVYSKSLLLRFELKKIE